MDGSGCPETVDGTRCSLLGMVAGAYLAWFVGVASGGGVGLLAGLAVAGLEGAYAGSVLGVAVGSAMCLFSGPLRGRIFGGLLIGAAAATAGLTLGLAGGVGGGAVAGIIPPLLNAGRLDFGAPPRNLGSLRWVVWVAVGVMAGVAGMVVLDGFRSMEL
jgi:hypothetical protein